MKLFAQGDGSVCVAVCVCLQCAATMCHQSFSDAAYGGFLCVLCVSGCISTDLHAPAMVGRAVFPILQTLRVEMESRAMFLLNVVIYRLFSFSSFESVILLVKQNLWEKTLHISFPQVDNF